MSNDLAVPMTKEESAAVAQFLCEQTEHSIFPLIGKRMFDQLDEIKRLELKIQELHIVIRTRGDRRS